MAESRIHDIERDAQHDYDPVRVYHYPPGEESEEYLVLEQVGLDGMDSVLLTRMQATALLGVLQKALQQ